MSTPMRFSAWFAAIPCVLCTALISGAQEIDRQSKVWPGNAAGINAIALSPNGTRLATCGLDGTIRIWDTGSGQALRVMRGRDTELYAVAFSGGGKFIITTGNLGVPTVLDAQTGRTIRELKGLEGWSVDLAISPDGRRVAAWGMDGRILIWDIEKGGPPRPLVGEAKKWGMAMAWSPDGRILAAGRATITLWDVEKGIRASALAGHKDFLRALAFSPDGRRLTSAGLDKTVRVWDVAAGRELYALEPEGFVHPSPAGLVIEPIRVPLLAVKFSPDGKTLATAGADRLVRLWEAETGRAVKSLEGHAMTVTALAFSPSGKTLYSAGLDKTVRVWTLER